MQSVLSILTSGLMLVHVAWGCCWHHTCDAAPAAQVTVAAEQPSGHCCHHHGDNGQQAPEQPCSPQPCQVECCVVSIYLPTQKAQLHIPQISAPLDVAAIDTLAGGALTPTSFAWEHLIDPGDSGPPLRLHLVHQILLI